MKKITFLTVIVAVIGFYAFPMLLARADSETTASNVAPVNGIILHLRVTAYASEAEETDDTPFITANGTYVHDGIVATNILPFGTTVEIPSLFGDKIFTVEDRMNPRMTGRMDIWMPSREQALVFGSNYADVVILGSQTSSLTVAER